MNVMVDISNPKKIREQAADWALRLGEEELDPAGRQAFEAWLAARPENAAAYRRAAAVLGDSRTILRQDTDFTRRNFKAGRRRAGGAIVSMLLAGLCLWYAFDGTLRLQADALTAANETMTVTLTDGTHVQLNGNSAIDEDFASDIRRIRLLKGEAYFEVAKDASRPFVVEAGAGEAKALGTAFNVNLVGGAVEVTVTESRVAVTGDADGQAVVLQPGDRVAYDNDGRLGRVGRVPTGFEAPWRNGRLVFEERPLSQVVEEIFRRLPGRVVIANAATGRRLVSGSFDLTDPDKALQSFGAALGITIVRGGPLVTIIY